MYVAIQANLYVLLLDVLLLNSGDGISNTALHHVLLHLVFAEGNLVKPCAYSFTTTLLKCELTLLLT